MNTYLAEYIWIDGTAPTKQLRSKTKVIRRVDQIHHTDDNLLEAFPEWGFDGSSTQQAPSHNSDCILKPVRVVVNPFHSPDVLEVSMGGMRGEIYHHTAYLVLCEVYDSGDNPHTTNTRAPLRKLMEAGGNALSAWVAFEQEYTLFDKARPLGFSTDRRYPAPQGPYYCGVGPEEVYGREFAEDHLKACLDANLLITGINAEVMPGQWEFQCGGPEGDPLLVSDHLWLARWLLRRVGETMDLNPVLDQKPVPGDWNGAGLHTNFSTALMRKTLTPEEAIAGVYGMQSIESMCKVLEQRVYDHLAVYGNGLASRLTGHHETAPMSDYCWGVGDRTASVRIPLHVARKGYGYLEDRRPGANADPYEVSLVMVESALQAASNAE